MSSPALIDVVEYLKWACSRFSGQLSVDSFNHGVGHIAFGPDGMLYVNSGSRTDGDETGDDPRYSKEGEDRLTSCIWRLDPNADKPEIEIYARGLRNAYGFRWNDHGEMYATDNGPAPTRRRS